MTIRNVNASPGQLVASRTRISRSGEPGREPNGAPSRGARFGLLAEPRYLVQAQPMGLAAALRARGHVVTLLDPEAVYRLGDERWVRDLDAVVARGRSWQLLCLLSWAEARGVPTVNRHASVAAVHNKAEMGSQFAAAGIPTPRTFLGPVPLLAAGLSDLGANFPIVLKPLFGDNARGIRVVRDPAELRSLEWPEPVALAQEFVAGDGYERKVYGVGDHLWTVRRRCLLGEPGTLGEPPASGEPPPSEPVPVLPEERELARRCRRLFGLELYGLDCIQTPRGTVVLEVNEFPNYTGVPDASERLADHVLSSARAAREWARS
ncbi:MAG: hypothetical protein DMD82_12560 [Candidatus Rokuibacteriota bacterium]|nr:MAG: hypothetical protein DMD82_12560 [Candidatus Rokubacteria bacterium]